MTEETQEQDTGAAGAAESAAAPSNGDGRAAPADELEALQKQLEAAKAQASEYLDGWQRARAEFANYKRRVEKEQSEAYQNATSRVIGRFVDVSAAPSRAS